MFSEFSKNFFVAYVYGEQRDFAVLLKLPESTSSTEIRRFLGLIGSVGVTCAIGRLCLLDESTTNMIDFDSSRKREC